MRRREFIAGLGSAGVWPLAAWAQRAERVRRVGVLWDGPGNNDPQVQPLVAALRAEVGKLGWVEGRNLRMDYRFDGGDPSRRLTYAEELVNLGPDVIFAFTGSAARAVQRATQVIPIVFVGGGEEDNKFAGSLARPAGNITGFANVFTSLGGKWLQLLKQALPRIARVGNIFNVDAEIPGLDINSGLDIQAVIDAAADRLAITIVKMPVRDPVEIDRMINAFAAEPNGGLLLTGASSLANFQALCQAALQYRLPLMYGGGGIVAEGLLMSHGPDIVDLIRGAASYVDLVLRGTKPSDLPIQYPTKFQLVVNLKTATALGLTIPEALLATADEVIQ
jgi:putative tryptophan/tyrosine transport system substrate-binding protein